MTTRPAHAPAAARNLSQFRLGHGKNLIRSNVLKNLFDSTRPGYFDPINLGASAESKMHALIARGSITHACGGVIVLRAAGRGDLQTRAQTIAIAAFSH